MKTILAATILILSTLGSLALAADGIECALSVYQLDKATSENVLLWSDTIDIITGTPTGGLVLAFSTEIEVKQVDSVRTSFDVHIVTLGPTAVTKARSFVVEYGLPARIDDIEVKKDAIYSLVISPLRQKEIDSDDCPFNHRAENVFKFNPTAHTDLYFAPGTLADFYWDAVKEVTETQYRKFRALFNFSLPGKYSVYLYPCASNSVIWDSRFGMALDPTRSTVYAIYSKDLNTADPFLVILAAIMRNWGYAPAFLTEGLANYQTAPDFDMKEIISRNEEIPLRTLLNTLNYHRADPHIADRTAASFVRFLIDSFGVDMFKRLYRNADDLTLLKSIETIYEVSIADLEAEWKTALEMGEVGLNDLGFRAYLAEMMFNYPEMLKYTKAAVQYAKVELDTLRTFAMLKRAYFFAGNYYGATEIQEQVTQMEPESPANWMAQGSYKMMNGLYDDARADFSTALTLDSMHTMTLFNMAQADYYDGQLQKGIERLQKVIDLAGKTSAQAESRVLIGHYLLESGDESARVEAENHFNQAIVMFSQALQLNDASPSSHMWLGIATLGLGDTEKTINFLETGLFLESRPFYQAMMYLWLGKALDLKGDREAARDSYGRVLALPSADYQQKEAHRFLKQPYSQ